MNAPIIHRLAAALADRYRIDRELGRGGMATVYLAQDLKHDRKVALKVLKPELAAVLGAERFVVEIKTTASLQHPHILPLFDSGTADGFLYYVMPFIDGETLRNKLNRETQLGVEESVKLATDVADALHYAHQHGVIHRDIKPENILLQNGRPMVADFGIALALSAAAGGRMTETGISLGTPYYMSPEQATAEKEITARSDVYSLGSVLYEMLAGEPPHLGGSAQLIIMKIIAEPVPSVTRMRKSVPPNVAAAVAKAIEKLPADRFESAKAFADALTNPSFRFSTGAGAAFRSPEGTASGRRSVIGLALLAVVALGLAAWGWLRPPAGDPEFQRARQLTFDGTVEGGAISSDGSWLAYVTNDCPEPEVTCSATLQVREVDGSQSVRLLSWPSISHQVRWSPGGGTVLFQGMRDSTPGVFLVDRLGGAPRRVAPSAATMDFTGDGRVILAVERGGNPWLIRYDPVSLAPVDSVPTPAGLSIIDLAVEPGGRRFAVVASAGRGRPVLALLGPDGRLLDSLSLDLRPQVRWDPAGAALLFFMLSPGIADDLFRLPLRGDRLQSGQRRLVMGQMQTGYEGRFNVSPGGRLAIVATPTTHQMEVIHLDAARPAWTAATARTGYLAFIAMSPDGSRIAASATDNLGDNVYVFPVAGGAATPLTALPGARMPSDWSPDGRRVAYLISDRGLAITDLDGGHERLVLADQSQDAWVMWLANDTLVSLQPDGFAVFDTLGRVQRTVAIPDSLGSPTLPKMDPRGGRLAYWSVNAGALVVAELRGGTFTRWAQGRVLPAGWIADGTLLVQSDGRLARLSGPGKPLTALIAIDPECPGLSVDVAGRVAACERYLMKPDVWLADRAGRSGWWE